MGPELIGGLRGDTAEQVGHSRPNGAGASFALAIQIFDWAAVDRGTGAHHLRQHMAALRRKLEPDPTPRPRHLLTELGMGYRSQP